MKINLTNHPNSLTGSLIITTTDNHLKMTIAKNMSTNIDSSHQRQSLQLKVSLTKRSKDSQSTSIRKAWLLK